MAKKNVLEKVPEFVAAFEEVRTKGHFRNTEIKTIGNPSTDGGISFLGVSLEGFIPSKPKLAQPSVDQFVDANALLTKLRGVEGSIETVTCEVKRKDWPLWSKDENSVIRSKGFQISFCLQVVFKYRPKKKARSST